MLGENSIAISEMEVSQSKPRPLEKSSADANDFFAATGRPAVVVEENRNLAIASSTALEDPSTFPATTSETSFVPDTSRSDQGEIVPDETQLLNDLKHMLVDPWSYTPEQAQQILADTYAGRTFEQLQAENPALAEALTNIDKRISESAQKYSSILSQSFLSNETGSIDDFNLNTDSTEIPIPFDSLGSETIPFITSDNVDEVTRISEDELHMTVTKPDGERVKVSTNTMLLGAALIAADLVFFKGSYTFPVLRSVLTPSLQGITTEFMARLGVNIPEEMFNRNEMYDMVINSMDTKNLKHLFEEFPEKGQEIFNFLSGVSVEIRQKMLTGERFGKYRQHQLNSEQITAILNKLSESQKQQLQLPTLATT